MLMSGIVNFVKYVLQVKMAWMTTCKEKKHKCKEATFREQKKDNKNLSIGLFPKNSGFIQLVERHCDDMILGKKSEEGSSSPNNNHPPYLLIDDNADDMRKNVDHEKKT